MLETDEADVIFRRLVELAERDKIKIAMCLRVSENTVDRWMRFGFKSNRSDTLELLQTAEKRVILLSTYDIIINGVSNFASFEGYYLCYYLDIHTRRAISVTITRLGGNHSNPNTANDVGAIDLEEFVVDNDYDETATIINGRKVGVIKGLAWSRGKYIYTHRRSFDQANGEYFCVFDRKMFSSGRRIYLFGVFTGVSRDLEYPSAGKVICKFIGNSPDVLGKHIGDCGTFYIDLEKPLKSGLPKDIIEYLLREDNSDAPNVLRAPVESMPE